MTRSHAATLEPAATAPDPEPPRARTRRTGRLIAAIVMGFVAALAGLATAELVSAASKRWQSPVLDVADRVVDGVPNSVKTLAIDWFGTNDKIALLAGIASILAIYAALLGVLASSRWWRLSIAGVALFGLAGAYASQSSRRNAPLSAVVPSLIGAAVAGVVLLNLRRLFTEICSNDAADGGVSDEVTRFNGRRRFLAVIGGTAAGAFVVGAVGRTLNSRSNVAAQRNALGLPLPSEPLPDVGGLGDIAADGAKPFFTPNADFYRIDTAITVPRVDVDGWHLDIDGLVDRPISLTYDDLLARDIVEADITLTCVSNEIGGNLLGTARWTGVRLDDLLAGAGVDPGADQIVGRSVDGYTCGFPVSALDGRDALVAIGMNGEPLPLEHGFPARLIVPGLYGYVSATKWLTRLELTRFDRFDQYWVERGWVEQAPIKVQSRIDTPRGLSNVASGTVAVAGTAWAQTRGIERVEVQINDGDWVEATLADELNDVTWRQWSYAWQATPGRHTITVRATERNGPIQTADRSEPFPSGATGQHQIVVLAE